MWVYDGEEEGMVFRDITYVPGLYKIFDEIIVNAADHKQRDSKMDTIKVEIDAENNKISIYNNGRGIDVAMHKVEKVYVPTLIFGHLLTGANFDDTEKKVVGGRNGFGAKLCNIFSTKFIIETSSKKDGKYFKQTWKDNMAKAGEPIIKNAEKEDFTRVTFYPDLTKFHMTELDKDVVALFTRRAYDIAGSTKGVKVYLNGKRLPIKGFKDYIDTYLKGKTDDKGNPIKCVFEQCGPRWEIAVALSEKGFQQVSFVNSIATNKGGRHVDHVAGLILDRLADELKKKNKSGIAAKPFQIKNHIWVFVNCLIENPAFDSQTKECLNTQVIKFGSKCSPTETFFKHVLKTPIVESVNSWLKFKSDQLKDKACAKVKYSKLHGIPKLEDANDAGTKNSADCTLILTEGDSAKALVVAGLSVVGRDKYGVFPLKGKLLNVREASSKQIAENAEISNIIKIVGLQYKKKYESVDDLKSLRYGRLMIMTDQDQDGSHIKGLLINFIHHNWPGLLKLPFLEEFITPIVKATKGHNSLPFYSLPEFEEWKKETTNWSSWKIKYYKGLGTSTSQEGKEYFSDLARHRIRFKYEGAEDDNAINLAFSKKMVDARKDWLTSAMESRKMRRELGLGEIYLYGKDTKAVTYKDFVNKELVLFSNLDNERSIPSLVDGLKPGQRKVLFTCFKRNDKREVKVAQLAGSVSEQSAYHHGEASLLQTIIGLAQDFVGSNNINLLQPLGQFGTRADGGKDHASPRYIFTMLSPLARKIFPVADDPLLKYQYDDNLKVEPEYYVPILPMVLVNGAEGIGTGWSTKIPNYNTREIVNNLRRMLDYDEPRILRPWFKGFRGQIDQVEANRYVVNGEVAELDNGKIEITELPVRTWTVTYKSSILDVMVKGTDKTPQFITDYKEYHTTNTVRFVVTLPESNLRKALAEGVHKTFKLQSTFTTTSMILFDSKGCLRKYENAEEILKEFYQVRLEFYDKRKTYMLGLLQAEAEKLKNQARFIQEKIDGDIKLENRKRKAFIQTLEDRGYKSDPVKKWRRAQGILPEKKKKDNDEDDIVLDGEESQSSDDEEEKDTERDYDYLMDMPMKSMLLEKKEQLLRTRDAKIAELNKLEQTSIQDLWRYDLDAFMTELDKVEAAQREAEEAGLPLKGLKAIGKGKPGKGKVRDAFESKPSEFGTRIEPKIDFAGYAKNEQKKNAKKAVNGKKKKSDSDLELSSDDEDTQRSSLKRKSRSDDENDFDATIIEDNGESPKKKSPPKKTKSDAAPAKKTAKGKEKPIDSYFQKKTEKKVSLDEDDEPTIISDNDSDSDGSWIAKKSKKKKKADSDEDDWGAKEAKKKQAKGKGKKAPSSQDDDEEIVVEKREKEPRKTAAARKTYNFDDDFSDHSDKEEKNNVPSKSVFDSDEEDELTSRPSFKATGNGNGTIRDEVPAPKKIIEDDSGDDTLKITGTFDSDDDAPKKKKAPAPKKPKEPKEPKIKAKKVGCLSGCYSSI